MDYWLVFYPLGMKSTYQTTRVRELAGERVKQLRVEQGFTQEQLSLMTGLSRSNVSRIETGEANAGITEFLALASALDVSPSDLFTFPEQADNGEGKPSLPFSIPNAPSSGSAAFSNSRRLTASHS